MAKVNGLHIDIADNTTTGTRYFPYLITAACICIAALVTIPKVPTESKELIAGTSGSPDVVIEQTNLNVNYESEWDKLKADIDASAAFLLSAVDLSE